MNFVEFQEDETSPLVMQEYQILGRNQIDLNEFLNEPEPETVVSHPSRPELLTVTPDAEEQDNALLLFVGWLVAQRNQLWFQTLRRQKQLIIKNDQLLEYMSGNIEGVQAVLQGKEPMRQFLLKTLIALVDCQAEGLVSLLNQINFGLVLLSFVLKQLYFQAAALETANTICFNEPGLFPIRFHQLDTQLWVCCGDNGGTTPAQNAKQTTNQRPASAKLQFKEEGKQFYQTAPMDIHISREDKKTAIDKRMQPIRQPQPKKIATTLTAKQIKKKKSVKKMLPPKPVLKSPVAVRTPLQRVPSQKLPSSSKKQRVQSAKSQPKTRQKSSKPQNLSKQKGQARRQPVKQKTGLAKKPLVLMKKRKTLKK